MRTKIKLSKAKIALLFGLGTIIYSMNAPHDHVSAIHLKTLMHAGGKADDDNLDDMEESGAV